MSYVTRTNDTTNEITWAGFCHPSQQTNLDKTGETLHDGFYPKDRFSYDGTTFNLLDYTPPETLSQIVSKLRKHLNQDTNIPETDLHSREAVKKRVDVAAGKARIKMLSAGHGIEQEYQIAYEDATKHKSTLGASGVPETMQALMDAKGMTAQQAQDHIIAMYEADRAHKIAIRTIRLAAGKAIDDALFADVATVAQTYIDQLENL